MFILDFFLGGLMDQLIDWIYSQLVGFFGNFFAAMGNMGVELFDMEWVQSIVLFFSYLGWALYGVGLVVAVFEVGIECQTGRANVKDAALNAIKGFMAVGCFTLVPVELYKLSVTLQASLTAGITGYEMAYQLNAEEKSAILDKMGQYCREKYGQSLLEFAAEMESEITEMETPQM